MIHFNRKSQLTNITINSSNNINNNVNNNKLPSNNVPQHAHAQLNAHAITLTHCTRPMTR